MTDAIPEKIDGKAEARRRIEKALTLIEDAQGLLGAAAQVLCPVLGSEHHWDLVGKGYDKVHDLWREVRFETAAREFDMDSEWKATQGKK